MTSSGLPPYLGKSSKNLVSKITPSDGTSPISYTYKFDSNGNVTQKIKSYSSGGPDVSDFTYQCN